MTATFPRFPLLPTELRLKIWEAALPGPRTIHVVKVFVDEVLGCSRAKPHCTSTVPCPKIVISMLHTCSESRMLVLRCYKLLFLPRSLADPTFSLHYFDPTIDGVFVDDIWPWVKGGNTKPAALYEARRLSISCNAWWAMWRNNLSHNSLLGQEGLLRFKQLEELHIVFRILTDCEREKIMQYKLGLYMGPREMSTFLRRPHDIDFPSSSVDIQLGPIQQKLKSMRAANPGWQIPKVRLIAWATRSNM